MESVNLSTPRLIPKCRRRYNSYSSPVISVGSVSGSCPIGGGSIDLDSETITGNAYLCFYDDDSGFEGHVITGNNSHYRLVGRCMNLSDKNKPDAEATDDTVPFVFNYKVTLVDLEVEQSYVYNRVSSVETEQAKSLLSPNLTFKASNCYKGHKADMLIQEYLTPRLVGNNFQVYAGSLTADLSPTNSQPNSWKSSPLWCI
ncbi:hypothetical protein CHUAL_012163 [Chamberlinius hualienensis]